jgi:hypothetical protein
MLDSLLYDSSSIATLSPVIFAEIIAAAVAMGIVLAFVYMYKSRYTKSFAVTLAMLPAIVAVVIMMVNGNIGAGVAVAGAFSLVRFRSAPGSAKDISFIFLSMAIGLVCGMGYIAYAAIIELAMGAVYIALTAVGFGERSASPERTLVISVPEDFDYESAFDSIFAKYLSSHSLVMAKTANMGSIFKLSYDVVMKDLSQSKAMIDELRCHNGNLEICLTERAATGDL